MAAATDATATGPVGLGSPLRREREREPKFTISKYTEFFML